ncbi:MAG: sensor histidine kinase [Acidobacteriota bacterium]
MRSPIDCPALADAADLLNAGFARRARRFSRLTRPVWAALDARFLRLLERRGFDARQMKALTAITPGAAARLVAQRKPLADFVEQVEYSGRRLAKLDVEPSAVADALSEFSVLLARACRDLAPEDAAEIRWLSGQLTFCSVLTLNNAYYQVREAETRAFFELHDAELKAATPRELVQAYCEALSRYVRADAACCGPSERPPAYQVFRAGNGHARLLLDPSWNGRYRSVWSIPLGDGVAQFGFKKQYDWLPRELRLLADAAARSKSALEKLRLSEQLAAREGQLRDLALRMLDAEERERRRIRRELHDETAQLLPYLRLQLEMIERAAPDAPLAVRRGLAEARELIGRTVAEIRRVLADLSPAVLEQLGLVAAVRQLLNEMRRRHGVEVRLDTARLGRVPKKTEIVAYRIVQECCNNVVRHSSASHLNVSFTTADGKLKMRIVDDGVGFRVEEALSQAGSFGLAGMRERVALAGGRFDLASRPGHGTRVSVEIPIPASEAARVKRRSPRVTARRRAQCIR